MRYRHYEWEVRTIPIEVAPGAALAWEAEVVGLWYVKGEHDFEFIHLPDVLNLVAPTEGAARSQCEELLKTWIDRQLEAQG